MKKDKKTIEFIKKLIEDHPSDKIKLIVEDLKNISDIDDGWLDFWQKWKYYPFSISEIILKKFNDCGGDFDTEDGKIVKNFLQLIEEERIDCFDNSFDFLDGEKMNELMNLFRHIAKSAYLFRMKEKIIVKYSQKISEFLISSYNLTDLADDFENELTADD